MAVPTILSYSPTSFDYALVNVVRITVIVQAILFHGLLMWYMYQETQKRGNPIPWVLLVFFSNLLGIIVYFSIAKDKIDPKTRIASALWLFTAFLLIVRGGLLLIESSSVIMGFMGSFFFLIMLLPIILFIETSGIFALYIGFQVIKGFLDSSEILNSYILVGLGLGSFLSLILSFGIRKEINVIPYIAFIIFLGIWYIIIVYACRIRKPIQLQNHPYGN